MSQYDDIINLPHHQSKTHPHMSLYDRAAQFAPFAALSGYEEAICETGRTVDEKIELSSEQKDILREKLSYINSHLAEDYLFTYFVKDEKKSGGSYVTKLLRVKKIDDVEKKIITVDKIIILFDDIMDIKLNEEGGIIDG